MQKLCSSIVERITLVLTSKEKRSARQRIPNRPTRIPKACSAYILSELWNTLKASFYFDKAERSKEEDGNGVRRKSEQTYASSAAIQSGDGSLLSRKNFPSAEIS